MSRPTLPQPLEAEAISPTTNASPMPGPASLGDTPLDLDSMTQQYKRVTYIEMVGVFLLPVALVGAIIIYWGIMRKVALGDRVAAAGYDQMAWEAPLRVHARKRIGVSLLVMLLAIVTVTVLLCHLSVAL